MSFETIVMADIQPDKPSQIPTGEYVFELLPTAEVRTNKFTQAEELNLSAAVADGDYKGRRVFWNYPDPDTVGKDGKPLTWSKQAMKKLEVVLGIDSLPGEAPRDYFNRAASMGARFGASYGPNAKRPYIPTGETEARNEINIFSVKPAV